MKLRTRTAPILRTAAIMGLALFAAGLLSAAKPAPRPAQTGPGENPCLSCHEDVLKALSHKPHAASAASSCVACHTGPEAHLKEGGGTNILAFKASDPPARKSGPCLTCHADSAGRFMSGPHGRSSLDCTTCHGVHAAKPAAGPLGRGGANGCAACHEDVMAKFNLNARHRLQEGILDCTTCHDPHEPSARERLGGFKQEECLKCHTDKGGPFLHEHGASRVEGCTACHDVHGSPNRHMLTTQSVADLCFSCHVFAPAWHNRFDAKTSNCTSCHSTIHGSNLSRIFIK